MVASQDDLEDSLDVICYFYFNLIKSIYKYMRVYVEATLFVLFFSFFFEKNNFVNGEIWLSIRNQLRKLLYISVICRSSRSSRMRVRIKDKNAQSKLLIYRRSIKKISLQCQQYIKNVDQSMIYQVSILAKYTC